MRPIHWLFLNLIAFLVLIAARLVQDGMFIDGLWYAAMSNNLARGTGSLWHLHFTPFLSPDFTGQPAVHFWMQSQFFRVLGDGMAVERLYCLLITLLSAGVIVWVWRRAFGSTAAHWWPLPLALWLLNEETGLRYTSNLLDTPMALFDLLAVAALMFGVQRAVGERLLWILLGGIFTALAFLTKGPAGLFPLAFFGVWRLSLGGITWRQAIIYTLLLIGFTAVLPAWFWLNEPSASALNTYWREQVMTALAGKSEQNIAPWRFYMVQRFFEIHAHWLLLSLWAAWRVYPRIAPARKREAVRYAAFFGLLGASALLPVTVSGKQAAHYIVPSLPWFSLAFAALLWPVVEPWSARRLRWLTPVLVAFQIAALVFVVTRVGKTIPPAQRWLPDMRLISAHIPPHSTVAFRSVGSDYQMHGYFQRYHYTALDFHGLNYPFLILEKGMALPAEAEEKFEKMDLATKNYDLYRKM